MSTDYRANPQTAPIINRPGESAEYTGLRNIKDLLPTIFNTTINNKFINSTVEQLLSSGSLQAINNYIGASSKIRTPEDNYIKSARLADNYQFVPGIVNRDDDNNITDALSYDDLIKKLEFHGVDTSNHNMFFNENGYTLGLPINYDMFINYHKYFWMLQNLPIIDIIPTETNPIDIDDIVGSINYTTPVLDNGKTLTLGNGMRIRFSPIDVQTYTQTVSGTTTFAIGVTSPSNTKVYLNYELLTEGVDYNIVGNDVVFVAAPLVEDEIQVHSEWAYSTSGDYVTGEVYIIDNVGQVEGIVFTKQHEESLNPYEPGIGQTLGKQVWLPHTIYSDYVGTPFETPTGFDTTPYDQRFINLTDRDYVVEFRFSDDQSAWARSNLWVKEDVILEATTFLGLDIKDYASDLYRAVRPIIEFRENIEKYDFGTNHIMNVNHVMELIPDPSTDIIGTTNFSLASFVATTEWTETGFEVGDKVYVELGSNITYWECIRSHGDIRNPYHYQNRDYWKQIVSKNIENDDTILFIDSGPTYSENIYRASVDSSGTVTALTEIIGSSSTTPNDGDKVVAVIGYNDVFGDSSAEKNNIWGGSEWYWDNGQWNFGQQKTHKSKGILFQLYDIDKIKLDDVSVYPNSEFAGDIMFDYGKSETSSYDFALGFKPRRVDYGNNPGFEFDIGCSNIRYNYSIINDNPNQSDSGSTTLLPIKGFYYYKNSNTNTYFNNWKELEQPVKRAYQKIFNEEQNGLTVNLGTSDINVDNKFTVLKRGDNLDFFKSSTLNTRSEQRRLNGSNPILYLKRNKTYTFKTHFDETELEFTDIRGNVLGGITRSSAVNDEFTILIDNTVTDNIIKYTKTSGTPTSGYIFLNDGGKEYNIDVIVRNSAGESPIGESLLTITNTILTIDYAFSEGDVIDVLWHSDSPLTNADGEFLPADTHMLNPQNERLTAVSYGDLQAHIKSQMENIPGFVGNYFGDNNYVNIPFNNSFGGTIRQQAFSTEIIAETSSSIDTDPFNSIRYSAQNYRGFRALLSNKASQLHKTLDTSVPVYELVDRALKEINIGKNRNSNFSQSDMAFYTDYEFLDVRWHNGDSQTFNLPRTINTFDNTFNHVQVWIKDIDSNGVLRWRSALKDVDYTLNEYSLTITASISYDSNDDAYAHIRWYPQNSVSYIPPSAAKLGLIRPFKLQQISNLYVDFNYIEDQNDYISLGIAYGDYTNAIILHDGSIHIRGGNELYDRSSSDFNIADAVIWELETRIYNNLNTELDTVIDYKQIMPSAANQTSHTWEDLTSALETDFTKWKIRNNIDKLNDETFYNPADKFTWNYRSVGPGIGGFKGLYTYYFNTDQPHLRPWEMLGYNKKPSWWDTNYAWDQPTKRAALIAALQVGHYNDPAETPKYNISYAYSHYDWVSNTLVTTAGELNDPVTANVVTAPTAIEAAKDFVFGDWGPVEASWRISSDYKISLFAALMKLRPLWVTNNFFKSINRKILNTTEYETIQYYFNDIKELGNNREPKFTYTPYEGSTLDYIKVIDGGSGYVTAPDLTVYSNFGTDALVTAHVDGGSIVAVSIIDGGENYQGMPTILPDSGTAQFDAFIKRNATRYYAGFSNSIVDYSRFNNVTIEDLTMRFSNSSFNPIIKVGGFVNDNQKFILESSQDKGSVIIPEENYNTLIYKGQPKDEKFFGSIKVTKNSSGYIISGVDSVKQSFTYYPVNVNADKVNVTIDNKNIIRYRSFMDYTDTVSYGTIFQTVQETYNFIIGYERYLEEQGWSVTKWISSANDFVSWAFNDNTNTGDSIYVKPDTTRIYIRETETGYYDNVSTRYDGGYNLIDANGKQINPKNVLISRDMNTGDEVNYTIIERKDNQTVIHGVRLYTVELEHIIVFDTKTDFDDVIYDPAIGQLQSRIIWRGSKTKDWNGKLYAPGYIVFSDSIVNNFDTTARELDQYYGPGQTLNNQQMLDVARFNIGYNKPSWSEELLLEDDTAWNLVKGSYKYKGTHSLLDALKRTTSLFGDVSDINFYEEWAIRTADYGDTRTNDVIEIQFPKDLIVTNPQTIRFTDGIKNDSISDIVIDVDENSDLLITGNVENVFQTRPHKNYYIGGSTTTLSDIELFKDDFINAGFPLLNETDYRVINKEHFTLFPDDIDGTYRFYGNWQDLEQWDNQTSYNYGDRVIYQGKVWEMVDQQATGFQRPNNPITVIGSITSPVVPESSPPKTIVLGTSSVDSTTIEIQSQVEIEQLDPITITGSVVSPTVPSGDTIILSVNDNSPTTITLNNTQISTEYLDIVKTGTVIDPVIIGGSNKKLTIDGQDIPFTDTTFTSELSLNPASDGTEWNITGNDVNLDLDGGGYEIYINNSSAAITVNDWDVGSTIRKFRISYDGFTTAYVDAGSSLTVTGLEFGSFKTVEIEANEWPSQADFDANINRTTHFVYIISVKRASAFVEGVNYDLSQIISEIQAVLDPSIYTVSSSSNRLRIVKTTSTPDTEFTMTINQATANEEVGFELTTQTLISPPNTITSNPDLTLTQVVEQINQIGISGITVQEVSNKIQISSNTQQLIIGNGTANNDLGLVGDTYVASTSTVTTPVDSNISQIVGLINEADISGISASESVGRLQITSTNPTLYIGSGTANSDIGIVTGTTTATQGTVNNIFEAISSDNGDTIFLELEDDPHTFNIWIANDTDIGGYNVYQAMDFDFYLTKACAGITEADDAQIQLISPHNLNNGDYVLINGSNTTPSIDGIHRVTQIDLSDPTKFYIDEFIDKEGNVGNVYPLRSMRFSSYSNLLSVYNTQINGVYQYNFSGQRQGTPSAPIYAFVDNNGSGSPAVYQFIGNFDSINGNVGYWKEVRVGEEQSRNDLIDNIKIFDATTQTVIDTFEIFDPFKGIIPGFIDIELDYKQPSDIAVYNFSTVDGEISENQDKSWQENYIGKRWWDLKTAIYLNYEQGSVEYKQNNWGRLFDGASIDIYEWTKSPVLPEEWEDFVRNSGTVDGVLASGEPYSNIVNDTKVYFWVEKLYFNKNKNRSEKVYYFWVKNKITKPSGKLYNTIQLSTLLKNPTVFGIKWAASTSADQLLISNGSDVATKNTVLQINKLFEDTEALTNSEYTLLSEDYSREIIPEYLHIKMRDNLVGYNQYSKRYSYETFDNSKTYSEEEVVLEGSNFYISVSDSNLGNTPSGDTDQSYWKRVYEYELPDDTTIDDIDILQPLLIPDIRLHPFNRYGHLERPVQSLNRNIVEARQNIVYTINDIFSRNIFVNEFSNIEDILGVTFTEGEITYDLGKYWQYTDYIRRNYNNEGKLVYEFDTSIVPSIYVDTLNDIETISDYNDEDLVYIRFIEHSDGLNRPAIVRLIDGEWITEWKKLGTISFSEELWNQSKYGQGYDAFGFDMSGFDSNTSNILKMLLDILRNDVFVNTKSNYYSDLWFSWLNHAVTENTTSEFAFKTTYGTLKVDHPLLTNAKTYQTYRTNPIENFFNENKPFHTKVRQVIDSPTYLENSGIEITETFLIYIDGDPASLELHLDAFDAASIPSGVDDTIWEDISGV